MPAGGQKLLYKAFGLTISSEIYFSELETISEPMGSIDIDIKIGNLTNLYFESKKEPVKFVFNDNLVGFQFYNIVKFSIEEGKIITVSPMGEADEDQIRLFILGTCMSVILIQRKILPLHGSTVAINGKAYAFIGDSGAGKSTLASAFINQGYQLLTDDVVAVKFSPDNIPFVVPSYPQQKLWEKSLEQFGMEKNCLIPIYKRETKFVVPINKQYSLEPIPLAGIFELVKSNSEEVKLLPIENLMRIQTLLYHTYRNFIIPELGLIDWHFNYVIRIISQIDMYQLKRPDSSFTAYEMVSLILSTIDKEDNIKC
jgi:hypothetical protein